MGTNGGYTPLLKRKDLRRPRCHHNVKGIIQKMIVREWDTVRRYSHRIACVHKKLNYFEG